jgi:endonuclease/exonuclease/phosphatase family metal-dependent hydrolase
MKFLQLNVWGFKKFENIKEYLVQNQPEIVNLQEVSSFCENFHQDKTKDFFEELKVKLGYDGIFAPRWGKTGDNGKIGLFGNAILSKLPIVDYGIKWDKTLPEFEIRDGVEKKFEQLGNIEHYYTGFDRPTNLCWAVINYNGNYIRTITSHFTVSYNCQETLQHINQAKMVLSFLDSVKKMPTIFSGDLNISDQSATICMLTEKLGMVNIADKNTLNPRLHRIFEKFPDHQGYKVDHIMQFGFQKAISELVQEDISDHLGVLGEFEI